MKKVYVIEFKMFDGEEHNNFVEIFNEYKEAKEFFDETIEDYKCFWEDFSCIGKDENDFCAYDDGWYDNANIEIHIYEKEIRG